MKKPQVRRLQLDLFADALPLVPDSFYERLAVGDRVAGPHRGERKTGTVVQVNKRNFVVRFDDYWIRQYPRPEFKRLGFCPTDIPPPPVVRLQFAVGDRVIAKQERWGDRAIPATVMSVQGIEIRIRFDNGGCGTYDAANFEFFLSDSDGQEQTNLGD